MVTAVAEHNPQLNWNSLPAVTTINVTEQYSGGKQSTHDNLHSQEEEWGQKLLLTSVCDVCVCWGCHAHINCCSFGYILFNCSVVCPRLNMARSCDSDAAKSLELTEQYCGLAHLDFAFVPFDPSDYSRGAVAALFAFLPYFCGIFLIGYALASRSRPLAFVIAGFLVNEAVNKVLKNAFRQPRPQGAALANYGMPSSHSQFCAYLAICQFILVKKSFFQRCTHPLFLLLVGVTATMMWSRVYLGFHTLSQTVVGTFAGAAVAVSWITVVHRFHSVNVCLVWCYDLALYVVNRLSC